MPHNFNPVALTVFAILFLLVTVVGFVASRWRRGDLGLLSEWGLGGRRFGTWVTWFLVGGDIYTAYTFIAVPALVYGKGSIGFFAVPYTILVFPILFFIFPRLWSVAKKRDYITPADFVRGRYGSGLLALIVAFTGILATMPYIALQLVGLQAVIAAMGIGGSSSALVNDLPLIIAFIILALYTYQSGLRAPALVAVVKDLTIYITVIVMVIYIPYKLGGFGPIFDAASTALPKHDPPGTLIPSTGAAYSAYSSLALGSAFALFLYPHALTGVFSANSGNAIRRNATLLTAYSIALAIIALFGYMAIAANLKLSSPNFAVPDLVLKFFPSWFAGFAFAAVGIGALVPAAIMSIAAANLFTRNIYREYFRRNISDREESQVAKIVSLIVKAGALAFVIGIPTQYSINLQLLGGIWILQTLPAVVLGLYTRWFHRWALALGWLVGMAAGTAMAVSQGFSSIYPLSIGGFSLSAYAGLYALVANLVASVVLTLAFRALGAPEGEDETVPRDYSDLEVAREGGKEPAEGLAH
ncbi:monocarboxylate uptake permease MctP [Rubrobacter naiadicus]|uniref:monocarboxylate uptake permease MctP n=1 Tax=Rubrobacter naiadicus TaxID=1392641 RepID=UPI00235F1D6A|nr:sodium:solute symporter [Rubrobacter naiadicus]